MIPLSKRAVVLGLLASGAAGCGRPAVALPADMSLGNPRAPVTVIEYASVACPVCGRWYREVFPAFKAKYIDTGKIKYVAREMLVGDATEESIAAAGFLLARCPGKDKYFSVTDAIYNNQIEIYGNPRVGLLNIAKSMGMDENTFDACIKNEVALRELDARVQSYSKDDKVTATPTFVVNGVALSPGYHPLSDLDAAISAAQRAK
ncbi:MAG TPA: thioredoxin domain-containing protein [Caulobacteraceae bacterium]|nr:thioredoxin domain-containing protein [Caulobacteraceae bacterium]